MACLGKPPQGGGHCCVIDGVDCPLLTWDGDVPRCSVWGNMLGNPVWEATPAAAFMARWPGKTCMDWPQNIAEVMQAGIGLCCWQVIVDGN